MKNEELSVEFLDDLTHKMAMELKKRASMAL